MRLHQLRCQSDAGRERLARRVADADRWLPAAGRCSPGGPRTMADLLAAGPDGLDGACARPRTRARIADDGRPARRASSCSPRSRGPARSWRSGATTGSTPTRRASEPPPAPLDLRQVAELGRRARGRDPLGPGADGQVDYEAELARRHRPAGPARRRRPTPSTTSSATPASTTCRRATSSSATASGCAASRSTRSARWGPSLVTADEIGDPQDLAIRCRVGGEVLQEASTSQMYFGVAAIVSYCSQAFTLEPGDVIATGTPARRRRLPRPARSPRRRRRGDRRDRADRPARRTSAASSRREAVA